MKTLTRIFATLIDFEHILTPVAVEHLIRREHGGNTSYRLVYIFGIRIAYYATTKF